jgi:hypothetical protein
LAITWLTLGKKMATNFIAGFSEVGKGITGILGKAANKIGSINIPKLGGPSKWADKATPGTHTVNGEEVSGFKIGDKVLDKAGLTKELGAQRGKIVGQAFASALTLGVTNGLTSDNPGEAFGKTMVMGMVSILPTLISTAASIASAMGVALTTSFIAATAGIGALIIALGGGIAAIISGI